MKFLFIVQGDGRGHLTQAISLSDILRRNGHEVVEVLVGKSKTREVPDFFYQNIKTKVRLFDTPSFILKKNKKHIHPLKTLIYNIYPKRLRKYMKSLEMINRRINKHSPDVVINFYDMLAGLANLRYSINTPFINIGHQFLIKHPAYAYGKGDEEGMLIFRLVTMISGFGAKKTLALSFYPMKDYSQERMIVVPPLLRKEVLELTPTEDTSVLGYMLNQGFEDEVRKWHKKNPEVNLNFFWDNKDAPKVSQVDATLAFHTLDDKLFLEHMASCKAYISTAGFESICEAFYLGKPVMMIPTHIEQEINAKDAAGVGLGVVGESFNISVLLNYIESYKPNYTSFKEWVESAEEVFLKHLTTVE